MDMQMMDLGKGWAFPVEARQVVAIHELPLQGLLVAENLEHLRQSIMMILMTVKGERLMRPWFGCNLWQHIDSPINQRTLAAMKYEIYTALKEETRIEVKTIRITNPETQWLMFVIECLVQREISAALKLAYNRENQRWEGTWQE